MRKRNFDCSIDGGMRAAAARILLDRKPGTNDVQRIGPSVQPACSIVRARPVVDLEKTLFMLEYMRAVRRISGSCQLRCEQSFARATPHMQRLGHCAEIGLDPGRAGGRKCQ